MREWRLDVEHAQCGIDPRDGLPKLLDPRFAADIILFFHVLRFGCGHRTVHQNDLHQLDVACRKFLRAVVRPLSNIDWSRPWHEILPEWNGKCNQSHPPVPGFSLGRGNTQYISIQCHMIGGSNGYWGGCRMDVIQLDVLNTTRLPNL